LKGNTASNMDDDVPGMLAKVPTAFLEVVKTLSNFSAEESTNWLPEKIEVLIWPYEYAPDDPPAKWPSDWPDCSHPTSKQRGDSWSIFLDSVHLPELRNVTKNIRQKQAISVSGKKWAISYRAPFPSEKFWMNKTLVQPDDIQPVIVFICPDPWAMVIGSDAPTFSLLANGVVYYKTKEGVNTKKFDIAPDSTVDNLLQAVLGNEVMHHMTEFLKLEKDYYSISSWTDQQCPSIKFWYKTGPMNDDTTKWTLKSVSVYGLSNFLLQSNLPKQKEGCTIS